MKGRIGSRQRERVIYAANLPTSRYSSNLSRDEGSPNLTAIGRRSIPESYELYIEILAAQQPRLHHLDLEVPPGFIPCGHSNLRMACMPNWDTSMLEVSSRVFKQLLDDPLFDADLLRQSSRTLLIGEILVRNESCLRNA